MSKRRRKYYERCDGCAWSRDLEFPEFLCLQKESKFCACIVDKDNYILSVGYNGFPLGCDDEVFPWGRDGGVLDTKYAFVAHAELNAILNSKTGDLTGSTVYVTLFPCNECTKALIQKRVGKVVYFDDKYHDSETTVAARKMLDAAGIPYEKYQPSGRTAEINL